MSEQPALEGLPSIKKIKDQVARTGALLVACGHRLLTEDDDLTFYVRTSHNAQ